MKHVRFLIKIYARLTNSSVDLLLYHGFSTDALPCVFPFIFAKTVSWESFVRVFLSHYLLNLITFLSFGYH